MKMPSFKEAQLLREAEAAAQAQAKQKHKQLLQKNKEAARAMLSAIQSPQVSYVTEKKANIDVNSQ